MNGKQFYDLERKVEELEVRLAILEAELAEMKATPLAVLEKRGPGRPRKEAA